MKKTLIFSFPFILTFSLVLFFLFTSLGIASVTFRGGIISSSEILKTEIPKNRDDLIYDLTKLDFSHLQIKLSITDAIRFENRIGIGAPYKRVERYIGMTRKDGQLNKPSTMC